MNDQNSQADDVRMRGFRSRSTVDEAIAWVDRQASIVSAEEVDLTEAAGRVLATDVVSPIDVPAFDRSAMDGYAVRADETTGADDYNPLPFQVVGQSLPGQAFDGALAAGQAVRIMTGAPLPKGADSVVPAEYSAEENGRVELTRSVANGKHVGRTGEDVSEGTLILQQGRRLRPQDVGVLASLGQATVSVVRRPSVRVIVTGDELALPGQSLRPHQIYDANSFLLHALIERDGGIVESVLRVGDERERIRDAINQSGADVVVVSGGSSVGTEDHAPTILADDGDLAIHGIAMRPSSPTGMGRLGEALVFLLPGNPVSSLCAYDFFAGRALRQLAGRPASWPYRKTRETVARKIASAVGRVDYCRVRTSDAGVEPLAISGASMLSSTTRADGFVIIPAEAEGVAPGDDVGVYWYDA